MIPTARVKVAGSHPGFRGNGVIVFTALALSAIVFHPWHGGFLFVLFPLFWILLIVVLFAIFGRRRWRNHGACGYGQQAQASASAESVLAQRFANGDVDEKEYRARLEVLRASGPIPSQK
jgi:putative membrane protein